MIYEYYCRDCEKTFDIRASVEEMKKGLKVNCPECGSDKTIKLLGNPFIFSKGGSGLGGGCCGPGATSGCCG